MTKNRFAKIPGDGISILRHLNEVMILVQKLATSDCHYRAAAVQQCKEQLLGISIDIASVCSPDKDWDFVSALLASAGIVIPDDLDQAIREAE